MNNKLKIVHREHSTRNYCLHTKQPIETPTCNLYMSLHFSWPSEQISLPRNRGKMLIKCELVEFYLTEIIQEELSIVDFGVVLGFGVREFTTGISRPILLGNSQTSNPNSTPKSILIRWNKNSHRLLLLSLLSWTVYCSMLLLC